MPEAVGIHTHEEFKLGAIKTTRPRDAFVQIRWSEDVSSIAPRKVDHMKITPGLDNNNIWGICGPTAADNLNRIVTFYEFGTQRDAHQDEVNGLYTESSTPPFDAVTGENDNGVYNSDLFGAWKQFGLAGYAPVCYGQLADTSDASIALAIDTFGAVVMAVDLQVAQQSQTERPTDPEWDWIKDSGEWGGHDICVGAIDQDTGRADCYSWALKIGMTEAFRQYCMYEVWVPVFQSVLDSNKFNALVNRDAMDSDLFNLTGTHLPEAPPEPAPVPQPVPGPDTAALVLTLNDDELVEHVENATHRGKFADPSAWLEHHLRSYFK